MTSPRRRLRDSSSLGQLIAASAPPAATITTGVVTVDSTTGATTLTVGGIRQTSVLWSDVPPGSGDNVLVIQQGGTTIVLGPVNGAPRPLVGTVTTIPAGSKTVVITLLSGATANADFVASYTPTVADKVYLAWTGNTPIIVGLVGTTAGSGAGTGAGGTGGLTPPPSSGTSGTSTFPAVAVGTYRTSDGWRTDANGDVIQGDAPGTSDDNAGAWFYGGRIAASLAGVTVTGASLWLGRTSGGTFAAQNLNLQRVTNDTQPTGPLSFTGSVTTIGVAVGQSGQFGIPVALAQALITSGGSLGISGSSPYMRMFGLSKSGQAGTITINWSR